MSIFLAQNDSAGYTGSGEIVSSMLDLLKIYAPVIGTAFLVTLVATPLVRWLAIHIGAVDKPDLIRKTHTKPVAYMGGVAVFAGLIAAIGYSYVSHDNVPVTYLDVPLAIIIGLVAITFTGLADDLWGWDPRWKIAGQLVAAAALAIEEVGVKIAAGIILPVVRFMVDESLEYSDLIFSVPLPLGTIPFDLIYWVGTGIIAIFVLGGCNAANLIDGLDGLLSGVTGIVALGLLMISLLMAIAIDPQMASPEQGTLVGARIVLSLAVLGAVLGFLPYNFHPASIFLGDCGSLLLGYCSVVVILMMGDEGHTHLVICGLIIFTIPVMDTLFAIIRRKLAGVSLTGADDQHIHHRLRNRFKTVQRAVLTLYAVGLGFALLGVGLAATVLLTSWRARLIYLIAALFYLGLIALAFILASKRPGQDVKPIPEAALAPPSDGDAG